MEGIYPGSQQQGLAVITDHQPLLSMEDQLCRGRVVVLRCGLCSCPLGVLSLGFPPGGAGSGQPQTVFCLRHPASPLKHYQMAATCPGAWTFQDKAKL